MIAKAGAAGAGNLGLRRRSCSALGDLVGAQARQRIARKLRLLLRHLPYQFEKQRKRAWRTRVCAFMLQRTMLR